METFYFLRKLFSNIQELLADIQMLIKINDGLKKFTKIRIDDYVKVNYIQVGNSFI